MSEKNKALARRSWEEAFNKGNLALIDELYAPNVLNHNPMPGQPQGREGVKYAVTFFRKAFPDFRMTIDDMIAEGDKVMARFTCSGTHKGELMGIPPTNKPVKVEVIDILRIAGGKIVERWGLIDNMGLMQQLGAVPAPGQAGR